MEATQIQVDDRPEMEPDKERKVDVLVEPLKETLAKLLSDDSLNVPEGTVVRVEQHKWSLRVSLEHPAMGRGHLVCVMRYQTVGSYPPKPRLRMEDHNGLGSEKRFYSWPKNGKLKGKAVEWLRLQLKWSLVAHERSLKAARRAAAGIDAFNAWEPKSGARIDVEKLVKANMEYVEACRAYSGYGAYDAGDVAQTAEKQPSFVYESREKVQMLVTFTDDGEVEAFVMRGKMEKVEDRVFPVCVFRKKRSNTKEKYVLQRVVDGSESTVEERLDRLPQLAEQVASLLDLQQRVEWAKKQVEAVRAGKAGEKR